MDDEFMTPNDYFLYLLSSELKEASQSDSATIDRTNVRRSIRVGSLH